MKRLFLFFSVLAPLLSAQTVDTLFYGDTPTIRKNPYGSGYIAGTNGYGDIGKYQRFDVTSESHVVGAKVYMAVKRVVGDPDSIHIVFKRPGYGPDNFDSTLAGPGATVTTVSTTLDLFDTTLAGNVFLLQKPFNMNGGIFAPDTLFVGLEWSSAVDDTFALFCDDTSQGEKADRAWEQLTGVSYKYQRFNEPGDFTWALDADLWIALLTKEGLVSVRESRSVPDGFSLEQNFPNPFNPSTTIRFSVPRHEQVVLKVYDVLGNEVATLVQESLDAGTYAVRFSGSGLSSGLYYCTLHTAQRSDTRKMLLLK